MPLKGKTHILTLSICPPYLSQLHLQCAMYSINIYGAKSFQHCSLGKKYAVSRTIFLLAAQKNVKSCGIGAKDAPGELDKQKHSTSNYRHKSCSVRHRGRTPGDGGEVCTVLLSSLSLYIVYSTLRVSGPKKHKCSPPALLSRSHAPS